MPVMEGDTENESKLEVPEIMDGSLSRSTRIRRQSGRIILSIQNEDIVKGMIMMLDSQQFDGRKEAEKAVYHVLYEDENIVKDDAFLKKVAALLTGVLLGTPIPEHSTSLGADIHNSENSDNKDILPEHRVSPGADGNNSEDCDVEEVLDKNISTSTTMECPSGNTTNKNGDKPDSSGSNKEENSERTGNSNHGDHHQEFYLGDKKDEDICTKQDENPDCYTINHTVQEHGLAFILSYGQFVSDMTLKPRENSMMDFKMMKDILEEYGCKVMHRLNAKREDTLKFLDEVKAEWETGKYDILIGSISSHGDEVVEARPESQAHNVRHRIICNDGEAIYTDKDIVYKFDTKTNIGKPKLYFIQACRSRFSGEEAKDRGTFLTVSGMPQPDTNQQEERGEDTADARGFRAPPSPQKPVTPAPPTTNEPVTPAPPATNKPVEVATPATNDPNLDQSEHLRDWDKDQADARGQVCDTEKKVESESTKTDEEQIRKQMEHLKVEGDTSAVQPKLDATVPTSEMYEVTPPPCSLDSLVMFASAEGKFAYSSGSGGWLLSFVEKALQTQKINDFMELTELLTSHVTNRIALEMETINKAKEDRGLKSVPCMIHMLRKDIYLKPLPSENK